jgi:hypothetical protein
MVKINFDIEKSLKENSPTSYYNQTDSQGMRLFPKGVRFVKRIVINRNLVTFRVKDNIREEDAGEERVNGIVASFKEKRYLYNKAVPAIIVDPNSPKRYLGVSGFGRDAAHEILGWESCLYDILEFDTPYDLEVFKNNSNNDDDHIFAAPNTNTTTIKSVVHSLYNKWFPDTDEAILAFIKDITRGKSNAYQEGLLNTIRKEHISRWPTMKSLSSSRAKVLAKELNLPFDGDKNPKTESLGYVRKFTSKKGFLYDGMEMSRKNGYQDVSLTTWIDEPKPTTLTASRKEIYHKILGIESMVHGWISHIIDMPIEEVQKRSKDRFPLKFNGFFAQNEEIDDTKGGLPMEEGVVDVDGTPMKRLDIK